MQMTFSVREPGMKEFHLVHVALTLSPFVAVDLKQGLEGIWEVYRAITAKEALSLYNWIKKPLLLSKS